MLAGNSNIASVAEPWVLLPFIYPLRRYGVYAEYSHAGVHAALQDFMAELPNGEADFLDAVNQAAISLYGKIAPPGARYFLDKTPRYALICDEIIRAFPDGKFIFLWRNPLAVIASMMETWGRGRWNVFKFKVDLFDGIANLIATYRKHQDRCISITYEDLVISRGGELNRVAEYLGIEIDLSTIENFSAVRFMGSMGDPTGIHQYKSLSPKSLDKWKIFLNAPFRKSWCRRYMKWIGDERLSVMGYDLAQLLHELDSVETDLRKLPSDVMMALYGMAYCGLEPFVFKHKLSRLPEWKWVKMHD